MKFNYTLLPKTKQLKNNFDICIDLYDYAEEVYDELDVIGIINRTKDVNQLGLVKVKKDFNKSRYDYIMLQLYFHQIIKESLNSKLRYTYNNKVKAKEFGKEFQYLNGQPIPTIGDILQLLTIIYNIGHFYNTFTSTRALSMFCNDNIDFKNDLLNNISEERFRAVFNELILQKDYHRLHLLNAIIILEKCDSNKKSIILCKEILYAYLTKNELNKDCKLNYIFNIFQNVRSVSFIAYDLQIANTPLMIDICNRKSMEMFFEELLSNHNDSSSIIQLLNAMKKLLDDNVYNENTNAVCYYNISKGMVRRMKNNLTNIEYYDLFKDKDSILNKSYPQSDDFEREEILKLTFSKEQNIFAIELLNILDKMNNIKVGYYDRYSGEKTILVAMKKKCKNKIEVSFKVMQKVFNILYKIKSIDVSDKKYLLTCKFFLFFYCDENSIIFEPTISDNICAICVKGSRRRVNEIDKLVNTSTANEDKKHETETLKRIIVKDNRNDLALLIPSSILVYDKEKKNIKLCEFDGLVIYPNRKNNQLMFIEAKNTKYGLEYARNCLLKKFEKLKKPIGKEDITLEGQDAYIHLSV